MTEIPTDELMKPEELAKIIDREPSGDIIQVDAGSYHLTIDGQWRFFLFRSEAVHDKAESK